VKSTRVIYIIPLERSHTPGSFVPVGSCRDFQSGSANMKNIPANRYSSSVDMQIVIVLL
jgi:hypothetical protein